MMVKDPDLGKMVGSSSPKPFGLRQGQPTEVKGEISGYQEALIHPVREPGEESVSPTAIQTFSLLDYRDFCRLADFKGKPRRIWGCPCRPVIWGDTPLTLIAPALGAPYAAMVLEKLIILGARRVLVLGWCGSLAPQVRLGHLVLPTGAYPGDGTSPHYLKSRSLVAPHSGLHELLAARLRGIATPWHQGPVWSTDAYYRETPELVRTCRERGFLALEMELAALFAVARFRRIAVAGLLVVSDELSSPTRKPAPGMNAFRRAREVAQRLVLETAVQWEAEDV